MQLIHLNPINFAHGHQKSIKGGHLHHSRHMKNDGKNSTKLLRRSNDNLSFVEEVLQQLPPPGDQSLLADHPPGPSPSISMA